MLVDIFGRFFFLMDSGEAAIADILQPSKGLWKLEQ